MCVSYAPDSSGENGHRPDRRFRVASENGKKRCFCLCKNVSKTPRRPLVRSFSGDRCEPTPTAQILHGVSFMYESHPRQFSFQWGHDGYASTILHACEGRFRRRAWKCRNGLCTLCRHRGWSCIDALPNAVEESNMMRVLHRDSDGYLIRVSNDD